MKKIASIKNYAKKYHKQAGMTLIELTVVLLILIGLAGLLVPYVGSFTQTTHDSANSNNMTQLNNAFSRYVVEKNKLPPHVELLTNGAAGDAANGATGDCDGAVKNELYCGLASTDGLYTVTIADKDEIMAKSLSASGISMAVYNDPNIENKTFSGATGMLYLNVASADAEHAMMGGYNGTTAFAAVTGTTGGLTAAENLAKIVGRESMAWKTSCYEYMAFGLGDANELIQSTMSSAPVYFPEQASNGPATQYSHFIALVEVDKSNTGSCSSFTEPARFVGVVANTSDGLVGLPTLLSDGWQNRAAAY